MNILGHEWSGDKRQRVCFLAGVDILNEKTGETEDLREFWGGGVFESNTKDCNQLCENKGLGSVGLPGMVTHGLVLMWEYNRTKRTDLCDT